jgi:uncharacterized protein
MSMIYSKQNIFSKVKDDEKYFIVNLLSGNADLMEPEEANQLIRIKEGGMQADPAFAEALYEKGYLSHPETENKLFRKRYFDFIDNRDQDEIQLFYVLNYSCNFSCTYCYQDEYVNPKNESGFEVTDAFFRYIQKEFADRRKYITVFGGEPLLNSQRQKKEIAYLLEQANKAKLDVCFVTNGYLLEDYIEILKEGRIREIQVTIDGTENIHNERRLLRGGGKTFDRIVRGVDACLNNNFPVNLRMVIDKENIENLPDFARFAIDKGWTANPLFKTQIGRNYELHHCQSTPDKLFSRISLYRKIFELTKQFPHLAEFYKPAYSVARYLSQNGTLPDPLFDACPACKTEWAFDYTGKIYSCTATVGKADESLGTFYPEITRNPKIIEEWESRDVTTIPGCKECEVQLACGGGCGSVAKNKNGSICSPDCRPAKELLELGFAAYFE